MVDSKQPGEFDPERHVAVHHYREIGDINDIPAFTRAVADCAVGGRNAGKAVYFVAQQGLSCGGDYDLDPELSDTPRS